jgi:hypothetical protein
MAKAKKEDTAAAEFTEVPLTEPQKLALKRMFADAQAQSIAWPTEEEWKAAGRKIDRAIAIRDNLIAPPWMAEARINSDTAAWVAAEIERMKAAGEIRGLRITELAKVLEARMKKAHATDSSLRVVRWRHIKNSLPTWGLWPIK